MDELLDLLAGHLPAARQLGQHALAIRARLVHHLATLLLGHLDLGLGVGRRIGPAPSGLDLGLFAQALHLVGGFAQQAGGALLGSRLDLCCGLARGVQDARRLLAEHPGDELLVERHRRRRCAPLRGAQLAFEEALTLLQAGQLGRHHPQELTDLVGFEPLTRRRERRRRDRTRRRGVGTGERNGHRTPA